MCIFFLSSLFTLKDLFHPAHIETREGKKETRKNKTCIEWHFVFLTLRRHTMTDSTLLRDECINKCLFSSRWTSLLYPDERHTHRNKLILVTWVQLPQPFTSISFPSSLVTSGHSRNSLPLSLSLSLLTLCILELFLLLPSPLLQSFSPFLMFWLTGNITKNSTRYLNRITRLTNDIYFQVYTRPVLHFATLELQSLNSIYCYLVTPGVCNGV